MWVRHHSYISATFFSPHHSHSSSQLSQTCHKTQAWGPFDSTLQYRPCSCLICSLKHIIIISFLNSHHKNLNDCSFSYNSYYSREEGFWWHSLCWLGRGKPPKYLVLEKHIYIEWIYSNVEIAQCISCQCNNV